MTKLHFITGLPRSGTTLLGAILRQNPRFSGGMSSPLLSIVDRCLTALSPTTNEFAIDINDNQRNRILNSVLNSWLNEFSAKEVAFDCNRGWAARLPLIEKLRPDAKVIACVRNPAWVLDSIERVLRSNPLHISRILPNPQERETVYSRAEALKRGDRLIGFSLNATKEAYFSDQSERMILIDYNYLAARPEQVMPLIYKFLGEPWFEHDFDNVDYAAPEFDQALDTPGLHTVKRKVTLESRHTILPPDIFEAFAKMAFWNELSGTKAKAIVQPRV